MALMRLFWIVLAIAYFCFTLPLFANENVVVVVNGQSASSKLVANFYIERRQIPPENVVYLLGVTKRDVISVDAFRTSILEPIIKTISARRLNHIDHIIYSSGFPTTVDVTTDRNQWKERFEKVSNFNAPSGRVFDPKISLNSATYYALNVLVKDASYLSLSSNTYYRGDVKVLLNEPFVGEQQGKFVEATRAARRQEFEKAEKMFLELCEIHPKQIATAYWMARIYAWQQNITECVRWLKTSMNLGWCYSKFTRQDMAFSEVIDDPAIAKLLAQMPKGISFQHAPSKSFDGRAFWGRNGSINSGPDQGRRFILSTLLAVNRNQGISEAETIRYLQRSADADGTKPIGTFYFTRTNDVRSRTKSKGVDEAVLELSQLGFRTEVVQQNIPIQRQDILGLSCGIANFEWKSSGNRILPGAICENLTSYGGRLEPGSSQTKLTEFLRFGAAGSSGTVVEPFAIQAKFPHPRIFVHYVQGCSLAESFYQSVAGPFQLLIVGDPLCRPWGEFPSLKVTGDLVTGQPLSANAKFSVSQNSNLEIEKIDWLIDGQLIRSIQSKDTGEIKLDTRGLPDGYHEFRFAAHTFGPISNRSSVVKPVVVNNNNQVATIECDQENFQVEDNITFAVTAKGAQSISIAHNSRSIKSIDGDEATITVPAFEFGRGNISVEARAKFGNSVVRSVPLQIKVFGAISNEIPQLKPVNEIAKPKANLRTESDR